MKIDNEAREREKSFHYKSRALAPREDDHHRIQLSSVPMCTSGPVGLPTFTRTHRKDQYFVLGNLYVFGLTKSNDLDLDCVSIEFSYGQSCRIPIVALCPLLEGICRLLFDSALASRESPDHVHMRRYGAK